MHAVEIEKWLAIWLMDHPEYVLADHGDAGARWLAEDGWLDTQPAKRDPPFARHRGPIAWALVEQKQTQTDI